MEGELINYGVLSLIPAVLTVFLAFKTKNVVLSLLVSLYVGALIIAAWNPWIALQDLFANYLFVNITSSGNAQTLVMMSIIGGFVALIDQSGGARAFAKAVSSKIRSKKTSQTFAWLGGLAIFFSDSANSLILGPIFRPIMDKMQVSRAKLAYILDSTSASVCILVPITGWGVYIMSIIGTEFEKIGIQANDLNMFLRAVPFQFYAILALILVPLVAFSGKDFGPMAKSERIAAFGLTPDQIAREEEITVSEDQNVSAWNMVAPLVVLFVVIFTMFISWGFPGQVVAGSKIRVALTSGYFLASIVLLLMILKQKLMSFDEAFNIFIGGVKKMAGILVIIVLAWGVGSVCSNLGTSEFVVNMSTGVLTPHMVPALLFLIGSVISFATGTSWGTMAILLPLGINMAYSFDIAQHITIAAVLSGSLFGDHCAPILDTTVLSSMAAGCDHVEHVKTQLPYAGIAAFAAFITYIVVGFADLSAPIALVLGVALLLILHYGLSKVWGVKIESGAAKGAAQSQ